MLYPNLPRRASFSTNHVEPGHHFAQNAQMLQAQRQRGPLRGPSSSSNPTPNSNPYFRRSDLPSSNSDFSRASFLTNHVELGHQFA
eukprot:6190476-Pleurochrysis_carterae.AAC.3